MNTTTKRIRTLQRVKKTIETKTRKNNTSWIIPASELQKKLIYARGNKKIGRDTLIFSIDTATDCIGNHNGLCSVCQECYAKKSEQRFTTSYIFKMNQRRQFILLDVYELIKLFSDVIEHTNTPIRYIRWNEGGELRTIEELKKINQISDYLGVVYGIQSYIYTSRQDIIEQIRKSHLSIYLTINTSYINNKGFNSFVAVDKVPRDAIACKGDCRYCDLCKQNLGICIYCKKH